MSPIPPIGPIPPILPVPSILDPGKLNFSHPVNPVILSRSPASTIVLVIVIVIVIGFVIVLVIDTTTPLTTRLRWRIFQPAYCGAPHLIAVMRYYRGASHEPVSKAVPKDCLCHD